MLTNDDKKRIRLALIKDANEITTNTDLTPEDIDMLITSLQEDTPRIQVEPNTIRIYPDVKPYPIVTEPQVMYTSETKPMSTTPSTLKV